MNERTSALVLSTIPSPSGTTQDSSPGAQSAPFLHCGNQHSEEPAGESGFPRASSMKSGQQESRPGIVTQHQRAAQNCPEWH